ncbi:MAG: hypothetical protein ACP5N7_06680 [Candidatus Pacearchaeota archaeon]
MNEQQNTPTVETEATIVPPKPTYTSIREEVAGKLKSSGTTVSEAIVTKMVEDEIKRRTGLVTQAFGMLITIKAEYEAIRPDVQEFDGDGNQVKKAYSAKANGERQKVKKRLQNIESAINTALDETKGCDYKKLEELLKSGGVEQSPKTDENSSNSN